jgi:hypothetical protein
MFASFADAAVQLSPMHRDANPVGGMLNEGETTTRLHARLGHAWLGRIDFEVDDRRLRFEAVLKPRIPRQSLL